MFFHPAFYWRFVSHLYPFPQQQGIEYVWANSVKFLIYGADISRSLTEVKKAFSGSRLTVLLETFSSFKKLVLCLHGSCYSEGYFDTDTLV